MWGWNDLNVVFYSTTNRKDTAISFNLDDLEMFMNNQMQKVESSNGKICLPVIYQAIFVIPLAVQFPCEFSSWLELFLVHLSETISKQHTKKKLKLLRFQKKYSDCKSGSLLFLNHCIAVESCKFMPVRPTLHNTDFSGLDHYIFHN